MKVEAHVPYGLILGDEELHLVPAREGPIKLRNWTLRAEIRPTTCWNPTNWARRNLPRPAGTSYLVLAMDAQGDWTSFVEEPTLDRKLGYWVVPPGVPHGSITALAMGNDKWFRSWDAGFFTWNGTDWQWEVFVCMTSAPHHMNSWAERNLPKPMGDAKPFAAIDSDGDWYSYDSMPVLDEDCNCWCSPEDDPFGSIGPSMRGSETWSVDWRLGYYQWDGSAWCWRLRPPSVRRR